MGKEQWFDNDDDDDDDEEEDDDDGPVFKMAAGVFVNWLKITGHNDDMFL